MFFSQERINRLCKAAIIAVIASIFLATFFFPKSALILNEGDFPAFYSAGKIVHLGLGKQLYDPVLHSKFQNEYWPDEGRVLYFAYPPYTAAFFAPLGAFPGLTAKWFYLGVMMMAACLAVFLFTRAVKVFGGNAIAVMAYTICFFPILLAVLGGQNTSWSMLCVSAMIYFLSRKSSLGEYAAGMALGAWLFKPHFAALLFVLILFGKFWKIVSGFSVVALGYYLLGTAVSGWNWPVLWIRHASWFAEADLTVNLINIISLNAVFRSLAIGCGMSEAALGLVQPISYVISICMVLVLLPRFVSLGMQKQLSADCRNRQLIHNILFSLPAILLLSPHTAFYDVGILVFSMVYFLSARRDTLFLVLATITMDLGVILRHDMNPQILFVVPLIALYIKTSSFVECSPNNRQSY